MHLFYFFCSWDQSTGLNKSEQYVIRFDMSSCRLVFLLRCSMLFSLFVACLRYLLSCSREEAALDQQKGTVIERGSEGCNESFFVVVFFVYLFFVMLCVCFVFFCVLCFSLLLSYVLLFCLLLLSCSWEQSTQVDDDDDDGDDDFLL